MMDQVDHKPQHEAFINKLTQIVLKNLENSQFGVIELSNQVGISRSQLHRKVKLITQQSISQFICGIRLQEALRLLKTEDVTVSEVAYRVGFSSPTYFHKCFQLKFGCSPGDVKKGSFVENLNEMDNDNCCSNTISNDKPKGQFQLLNNKLILMLITSFFSLAGLAFLLNNNSPEQKSIAV